MIRWLSHTARGACMGIADIIPGVSGGTLALVLGIYQRFIEAISSVGPGMLRAMFTREFWRRLRLGFSDPEATGDDKVGTYANHTLFLGFLVLGIGTAIVIATRFIPTLLEHYPEQMKGLFLGLVLASTLIPYRHIKEHSLTQLVVIGVVAVGTFVLMGAPISQSGRAEATVNIALASAAAEDGTLAANRITVLAATPSAREKLAIKFTPTIDLALSTGQRVLKDVRLVAAMRGERASGHQLDRFHPDTEAAFPALKGATITHAAPTSGGTEPALWFVFVAGFIAISAMVLPGVSGAFILLMLGLYHYVTYNLRLVFYERDPDAMVIVAIFGAAVVCGILVLSRFLKWLLARHHDMTMAVLVGLMLGSLRRIWPFSQPLPDGGEALVLPAVFDNTVVVTAGLFIVGLVIVLVLERVGRIRRAA